MPRRHYDGVFDAPPQALDVVPAAQRDMHEMAPCLLEPIPVAQASCDRPALVDPESGARPDLGLPEPRVAGPPRERREIQRAVADGMPMIERDGLDRRAGPLAATQKIEVAERRADIMVE